MKGINMWRLVGHKAFHRSAIVAVSKPSPELDSIIRVDHAGELGADRIYAGQMAVLGKSKMGPLIQHMWDQEKVHKATFETLIQKYRVRPTALVPVWNVAGFLLGAGTALMGEKAAMACTVAVESVIVEHYNDQLRRLMVDPEVNKELLETIQKFRDEEQEHHDTGLDQGAEQAPMYKALTEVIKVGCKTAIALSKSIWSSSIATPRFCTRSYSTISQARENWDLVSAVALERKPVLSQQFSELEEKFAKMLSEIELERSSKSDHELRHEQDLKQIALLKTSSANDLDIETTLKQTAQDFEDACNEELKRFQFSPKEIETDLKSVNRKLNSHLLLLVKDNIGEKPMWVLPKGVRSEGETMREAAERVLKEKCGNDLQVTFMGNAPCGFYKYRYPKTLNTENVGAKIFFFKALHVRGKVNGKLDYQWSTRNELDQLLTNNKYLKSVKMFLIDEDTAVHES